MREVPQIGLYVTRKFNTVICTTHINISTFFPIDTGAGPPTETSPLPALHHRNNVCLHRFDRQYNSETEHPHQGRMDRTFGIGTGEAPCK